MTECGATNVITRVSLHERLDGKHTGNRRHIAQVHLRMRIIVYVRGYARYDGRCELGRWVVLPYRFGGHDQLQPGSLWMFLMCRV